METENLIQLVKETYNDIFRAYNKLNYLRSVLHDHISTIIEDETSKDLTVLEIAIFATDTLILSDNGRIMDIKSILNNYISFDDEVK